MWDLTCPPPPQAPWTVEGSSLPPAWPQRGTIEFQDYGLQYRKGLDLALKGITLSIQEREKVGPPHFDPSTGVLQTGVCTFFVVAIITLQSDSDAQDLLVEPRKLVMPNHTHTWWHNR